jgi:hypothetical protein
VVGALIVPEWQTDWLFKKYRQLRPTLPQQNGEVKGRLLNEAQVAKVLELLRKNSCIFEGVAIDMGLETQDGLEAHRAGQAEALTRHLTDKHHPEGRVATPMIDCTALEFRVHGAQLFKAALTSGADLEAALSQLPRHEAGVRIHGSGWGFRQ